MSILELYDLMPQHPILIKAPESWGQGEGSRVQGLQYGWFSTLGLQVLDRAFLVLSDVNPFADSGLGFRVRFLEIIQLLQAAALEVYSAAAA